MRALALSPPQPVHPRVAVLLRWDHLSERTRSHSAVARVRGEGKASLLPNGDFLIWSSFLLRSSHKKDDFAPIRQPSREEMNVLERKEAERTADPILPSRGGPGPLVSAHL